MFEIRWFCIKIFIAYTIKSLNLAKMKLRCCLLKYYVLCIHNKLSYGSEKKLLISCQVEIALCNGCRWSHDHLHRIFDSLLRCVFFYEVHIGTWECYADIRDLQEQCNSPRSFRVSSLQTNVFYCFRTHKRSVKSIHRASLWNSKSHEVNAARQSLRGGDDWM